MNRRDFVATAVSAAAGAIVSGERLLAGAAGKRQSDRGLMAGASIIDISPKTFPVIVNGSFLERTASRVVEPIHARSLVLDDGPTRVAICVADLIAVSRELADDVKRAVRQSTGIPTEHILISATHTHSAPSVIGALGSDRDEAYTEYVRPLLVRGIEMAATNLVPARAGWAVAKDPEHTHCRRWIYRSDRMRVDPFGERSVRAMMHPGHQNPDCIGPAGPIDPDITVLSVQSRNGRPLAVLANYSMHYYGAPAVSPDYYGPFCRKFAERIGADRLDPPFVAMMSHGTSGDLQWMDYGKPKGGPGREQYAEAIARAAVGAYKTITYHDSVPVRMRETRLRLDRRVPDAKRLAWAKTILTKMGDRKPRNKAEVYAREAVFLHEEPTRELRLQAVRIGRMGIAAVPCEVYGITGLKLKARSPLVPTMNIELANGCEGYIPPPEQHRLGGYNAWPARTAGLEEQAEPKIVEALLGLLTEVSGKPRRTPRAVHGPYARIVLASKPLLYWRMGELNGPRVADATPQANHGTYEDLVAFGLDGPVSAGLCGEEQPNRAAHFAGGRVKTTLDGLGNTYSVELWFWNGMPAAARPVAGYIFSRGPDGDGDCPGDHLGIGGTAGASGRLIFYNGNTLRECLEGSTPILLGTWHHVVLVRDGPRATVYLDGKPAPDVGGEAGISLPTGCGDVFVGGRCDHFADFEGKIDEVAVYDRALPAREAAEHYRAAGPGPHV